MLKKLLTIITLAASSLSFGQSISGGYLHSLFLCPNGTVKSSGDNTIGQLGIGGNTNKTLAESVSALSGIIAVDAGAFHSLFLKNDGTVWACGKNSNGQLGNGNTSNQSTPVMVNISDVIAISAGIDYSLFLKNDGTAWACGNNSDGKFGNGVTSLINHTPLQVNISNVKAISAGEKHSLFLKNDSTVWACGFNFCGQLGNGTTINQYNLIQVNISGVTSISAGGSHSLFLKADGTVWGCGSSGQAELGLPATWVNKIPKTIFANATAISARGALTLILKNNGNVIYNEANNVQHPGGYTEIVGLNNITEIKAGYTHFLFKKNDGTLFAIGNNSSGQFGNGITGFVSLGQAAVQVNNICAPPAPPTVNMSNMPTSVCLGSNLSVDPNISGSNPVLALSVDNSIQINNPKAITKNKNSVFVLNDNDAIARFDFNGTLVSSYPFISITGILAFAADDSSNVYLSNGDGNIYKCDSTGVLVNTLSPLFTSSTVNQLVFTQPVNPGVYPENLFLIDAMQGAGTLITGYNTYDNSFSNSNNYPSDSTLNSHATSMCIDNFYANKRALLADPVSSALRTRVMYPDGSSTFDYQEGFLVPASTTAGMAFDFIDADTLFNIFTVSSKTTKKLGMGSSFRNSDGTITSYLDTSITSLINPIQPIGMITTKLGSGYQHWIADRGQSRILRAYLNSYRISPALPAGIKYNALTGNISGTSTQITSSQTYQVILTTPYGVDTTYFSFEVTPSNGLSNNAGTGTSTAQQNDGLMVKYIDFSNCEKLIDIADSLGGTSPGQTQVSQTVYPLVSVIANDSLIRRATKINADNIDSLKANITFYYTYQDIQLYKQTTGSTLSNDTTVGTMQIAVLQMHDLPGGGKQPIVHSPITANWSHTESNWKAVVPVTKFSEFYAGDMATLSSFDCSNSGKDTIVSNDYYVWNYDSLFTSGDYVDTLINQTGCDSITSLHLTISITTGLNQAALTSGINVFPNPSNGVFNIKFENTITEPKRVRVTNVLGTEVYSTMLTGSSSIDLSNQSSGMYFISIENVKAPIVMWRVVKE
jgi:alpha-tubulin suppressor-like RCC1 family protein